MVATLIQNFMVHPAWVPVDVNAGAVTGEFVDVSAHAHFTFLGINNDLTGTATYTFVQSDDNAGTATANLTVIEDYWEMTHASSLLTAGLTYTHNTQTAANTVAGTANQPSVIIVEFESSMLGTTANPDLYSYVRCVPTESGVGAMIAAGFWILGLSRYAQDVIATATS